MLVSIIIPVYNVENFLERCLDSVQAQTYNDLEVIIINDGSTDNSPEIINRYAALNPCFKAFTIENSGLGGARNYGIEKANGEYIVFLDSDDYIAPNCIERLAEAAIKESSDIVVCNCYDVREDGSVIDEYKNNAENITTSVFEKPEIFFNRLMAWGKLFKKSVFGDLRFVARAWYEDMRLIPKLYLNAEKITYISDALFYYVQRKGSIMNNSNAARNLEITVAFDDLISYFKEKGVYDRFKDELYYLITEHVAVAAVTRVVLSNSDDKKAVLSELQNFLGTFDDLYGNRYTDKLDSNKKIILAFNKRRLYPLTELCMKIKNRVSK